MSAATKRCAKSFAIAIILLLLTIQFLTLYLLLIDKLPYGQQLPFVQLDKRKPLPTCMVFLHIPKSGGRTVVSFLKNVTAIMGFERQRIYGRKGTRIKQPKDLRVNYTFTLGHFTSRIFREKPDLLGCFRITLLREPVDRAISAFFFHEHEYHDIDLCLNAMNVDENNATNERGDTSERRLPSFHASRTRCRSNWQYSNDMTRRLAGMNDTNWNTRNENKYHAAIPTHVHLTHAKTNLVKYFDLVCYMHELESCAMRIMQTFQIREVSDELQAALSHMTMNKESKFKTKSRPDSLNDEDMRKFREANKIDSKLYDWALKNVQ